MAGSAAPQPQRYVIKEVLGKGGMGVVYRAYDNETRRDVTLKTLADIQQPTALELFRKECQVLSSMNHPNIVDVYDVGEMQDEEGRKPYFVMPLLPGATLDKLIATASHRLTVERVVDIMAQACRGLQAAHERGLVHRDIKPSNIFVLEDDSVKIIDFGVAHLVESRTSTTLKGTLHYMAPEQIQMQKPTPLSDLFSLAVVCYEALGRRRPFEGSTVDETLNAILRLNPPPVSDFNPAVNRVVSQVVHKAMAKQPFHRFASVREFGDDLQKGLRGEPIELFNEARIGARIQRAQRAYDSGEYDFAAEVLTGLEAEGYLHPDMAPLRRQIDQAVRSKMIRQLLDNARRCFQEEEYQLALQKLQEVIQIDPSHTDALTLKAEIENKRSAEQITQWLKLADEHLHNHSYSHARQALEKVLQLKPSDSQARKLMSEVDLQEQEYVRLHKEKEELYYAAVDAWRKGEVSAALSELERVLDLDRRAPDTSAPERAAAYQTFYNQVRSDHDQIKSAYDEARKQLNERNFKAALAICEENLTKHPGHALFQALKVDVEELQRQQLSAYIARIDREVDAEPDLDRRVSILREALEVHPKEAHFERSLQLTTAKRDLVNSIVAKARSYEARSLFNEAMGQWEMLRTIYASYPGLNFEIERVMKRREQLARSEAKSRWVEQIDRSLNLGEFQRALDLTATAMAEFRDDTELTALEQLARQGLERTAEAQRLLERAQDLCAAGKAQEGLELLRRARDLDERNSPIRAALLDAMLKQARAMLDSDWHAADKLTQEALDLEPSNALAKSLRTLLEDRRRAEFVDQCLGTARQKQAAGDLLGAIAQVEQGLKTFPSESRLLKVKTSLEQSMSEQQRTQARFRDLEEARRLEQEAEKADPATLHSMLEQSVVMAKKYAGDRDFESIVSFLQQKVASIPAAPKTPKPPAEAVEAPKMATPQPSRPAAAASAAEIPTVLLNQPAPEAPKPAPKAAAAAAAAAPKAAPIPPKPAAAQPPAPQPAPAIAPKAGLPRKGLLIAGGAAAVLLVAIFGAYKLLSRPPAAPGAIAVEIKSDPPGAVVRIDNQDAGTAPGSPSLAPGEHTVALSLPGYQPVEQKIQIAAGAACCDAIHLQPIPAAVHLTTDLAAGEISLDGQAKGTAEPGQALDLSNLIAGDHTLALQFKKIQTQLGFKAADGHAPQVSQVSAPNDVDLFVLSSLGAHGRLYSSKPVKISWDGQNFQDAGPDGIAVDTLKTGATNNLTIDYGSGKQRNESIAVGMGPEVNVFAYSAEAATTLGGIAIQAGEGDFTALVDGKKHRYSKTRAGFVIYNISAGKHTVVLQKPGFKADPASATVEVAANRNAPLSFNFVAQPTDFTVRGAVRGTQVVLGGKLAGTVGRDGGFHLAEVTPGELTIELRKRGWKSKTMKLAIRAGEPAVLAPPDSVLARIEGTLNFVQREPKSGIAASIEATANVIEYDGPREVNPVPAQLKLPAGTYNITFSANGYAPDTYNIVIGDGDQKPIPITLKKRR